jgi:hypothetical protein
MLASVAMLDVRDIRSKLERLQRIALIAIRQMSERNSPSAEVHGSGLPQYDSCCQRRRPSRDASLAAGADAFIAKG